MAGGDELALTGVMFITEIAKKIKVIKKRDKNLSNQNQHFFWEMMV
jgi:hypothetical protein